MNTTSLAPSRIDDLVEAQNQQIHRQTDRLFIVLMPLQWIACVATALWISPRTWIGASSSIHIHVWLAIFGGGLLAGLPVLLATFFPGRFITRQTIAIAQVLFSALIIHLSGGRIESHFHVFGSLAILAFYRDWRVIVSATVVVAVDHLVRGIWWPESVFGVVTASHWRWLEHAGWVVFEDIFLLIGSRQSLMLSRTIAQRECQLEITNSRIEAEVLDRTKQLRESEARFRLLVDNIPGAVYHCEGGADWAMEFVSGPIRDITGHGPEAFIDGGQERFGGLIDPKDSERVAAAIREAVEHRTPFTTEFRVQHRDGQERWVSARGQPAIDADGTRHYIDGVLFDISELKRAEFENEGLVQQLQTASRQAGMAEVATGVLHNVGNVLNSVNISANIIKERVTNSKATNLNQVAGMFQQHKEDLGAFLMGDEKGRHLSGYVVKLADVLTKEQTLLLDELSAMNQNIEHVKEIVNSQQSYAKVAAVKQQFSLVGVIEDAVRINLASCERHQIRIVREFQESPPIWLDKSQVLQILVNLIGNAKKAVADTERTDKQITLRTEQRTEDGRGFVRVSVVDNGVGIPRDNLTKIFHYGFTTRNDGHGFGLHNAANAARQMGAALTALSDGPGRGAAFCLDLPLTLAEVTA